MYGKGYFRYDGVAYILHTQHIERRQGLSTMLEQKYELGELVGRGGMGNVYAARNRQTGEEVAIKRMNPAVMEDNRFVQRFLREANLGAKLVHPNDIKVIEAGTDEKGVPYMVMELLKGVTLEERLKRDGTIPEEEAIKIVRDSLLGLQKAHQETVIHRDIKPANIFLCDDGSVRVMDFGIAKALEDSPLTRTGAIIGTLVYMSPEQTQGKPVDARSDIYSLGLVFYEMLAGKFPFQGKTPAVMLLEKVSKPAPPLPDSISPWLQTVVDKSLTRNPDDRFQSAFEMVLALKNKQPVPVKPFEGASAPASAPKEATKPANPWDKKMEAKANGSAPKPITTETSTRPKTPVIAAIIVIAVLALIGFMMMNKGGGADDSKKGAKSSAKTSEKSKGKSSE